MLGRAFLAMSPLPSSWLSHYTYQGRTLTLVTASGRTLAYADVPERVMLGLAMAASPGAWYNRHIKGCYAYTS